MGRPADMWGNVRRFLAENPPLILGEEPVTKLPLPVMAAWKVSAEKPSKGPKKPVFNIELVDGGDFLPGNWPKP